MPLWGEKKVWAIKDSTSTSRREVSPIFYDKLKGIRSSLPPTAWHGYRQKFATDCAYVRDGSVTLRAPIVNFPRSLWQPRCSWKFETSILQVLSLPPLWLYIYIDSERLNSAGHASIHTFSHCTRVSAVSSLELDGSEGGETGGRQLVGKGVGQRGAEAGPEAGGGGRLVVPDGHVRGEGGEGAGGGLELLFDKDVLLLLHGTPLFRPPVLKPNFHLQKERRRQCQPFSRLYFKTNIWTKSKSSPTHEYWLALLYCLFPIWIFFSLIFYYKCWREAAVEIYLSFRKTDAVGQLCLSSYCNVPAIGSNVFINQT